VVTGHQRVANIRESRTKRWPLTTPALVTARHCGAGAALHARCTCHEVPRNSAQRTAGCGQTATYVWSGLDACCGGPIAVVAAAHLHSSGHGIKRPARRRRRLRAMWSSVWPTRRAGKRRATAPLPNASVQKLIFFSMIAPGLRLASLVEGGVCLGGYVS
jgi:hypothetical protein